MNTNCYKGLYSGQLIKVKGRGLNIRYNSVTLSPVLHCWGEGPAGRGQELVQPSLLATAKGRLDLDNKEKIL
jgi:hypothetical protein